jgi:hypothetical protein
MSILFAALAASVLIFHPAAAAEEAKPASAAAEAKLSPKKLQRHYSKTVRRHIRKAAKKDGAFVVNDENLGKDWKLELVRIHTDRIVKVSDDTFFACADLRSLAPKDMTKVDLDFYATKSDSGWSMGKILIHKVKGRPRYTYNMRNEIVPVKY